MRIILYLSFMLFFACENNQEKPASEPAPETTTDATPNPAPSTSNTKIDSTYARYWCSIETLQKVDSESNAGNIVYVARLLASFHESCRNNVEFSEWANTLLFKTLKANPDGFLGILHKNDSLRKQYILENLAQPNNDEIDLKELISIVENSNAPAEIKKEIHKVLSNALNN